MGWSIKRFLIGLIAGILGYALLSWQFPLLSEEAKIVVILLVVSFILAFE